MPRAYPLEIIRDHTVALIGSAAALIDTGSPRTFRATGLISARLGEPIRRLVGTDVLRRRRVLLAWAGRRVVLDGAGPAGEEIPLVPHAGVYQVEVTGEHGRTSAFLDTGAYLSYAPESAVGSCQRLTTATSTPRLANSTFPCTSSVCRSAPVVFLRVCRALRADGPAAGASHRNGMDPGV